jgi:lipopolysaccharide biosynthesis protein
MSSKARVIAFYLPQFHPIPENDEWWGKGFTEWTNTAKAKPLFPGHYQPHVPADLGFYDLRVPETRIAQAAMAKEYGIEGFCYYHYWFAGKRLIERPFDEVLNSGIPDFPFCLCWANQTWTGIWHGSPNRVLIEQTYPGPDDDRNHFNYLLKAFHDKRYIKVDGKPMFLVYCPRDLPDPRKITDSWREMARQGGIKDLYLVGIEYNPWKCTDGFDAQVAIGQVAGSVASNGTWRIRRYFRKLLGFPQNIYSYKKIYKDLLVPDVEQEHIHPSVVPNWDNSPRSAKRGVIYHNSTPELFREHLKTAIRQISSKRYETRLIFVKSWNEWAEGNHLEPDLKFGKKYLEVLKEAVETSLHK